QAITTGSQKNAFPSLFQDAGILKEFLDEQRFTADERDAPGGAARQAVGYLEPFGVRQLVGERTMEAAMGAAEVTPQRDRTRSGEEALRRRRGAQRGVVARGRRVTGQLASPLAPREPHGLAK